jgi:hypothetical protein
MPGFGDLFDTPTSASAVDTFTDRVPQSTAFRAAVEAHVHRLRDDPEFELRRARDHVVVFHGTGGFGKTSLSERLEDWMAGSSIPDQSWGPAPRSDRPLLTTRIDLAAQNGFDLERAVLQMRATIGGLGIRPIAFDIALATWWYRVHGDESLPHLASLATSRGPRANVDVSAQLKDTTLAFLEEIGAGFGLSNLALRTFEKVQGSYRQRREHRRAAEVPHFEGVLESIETDDHRTSLARLPILLTGAIRELAVVDRPLWIVFVDTFEFVNDFADRTSERDVQRLIYVLPDVLWVLTGRRRLDWADERRRGGLEWVGPAHWPGLDERSASPRQHLVGELDDEDARTFVETACADLPAGAVTAQVMDAVVAKANGWPLYLDTAVGWIRHVVVEQGRDPAVEDFDLAFPELVTRVVRDLSEEEREALRLASLFPRFSPTLVARTSLGRVSEAAVIRLNHRGLTMLRPWPQFPHQIHDSLRDEILRQPPEHAGLTDADWRAAAAQSLAVLQEIFEGDRDTDRRMDCFSLAMSVALRFGIEAEWMVRAAGSLPTMEHAARALPPVHEAFDGTWASHLAEVLRCWGRTEPLRERSDLLADVVSSRELPSRIMAMAQRFRAYDLRNHGHAAEALTILEDLRDRGLGDDRLARRQIGITLVRLGRLRSAALILESGEGGDVDDASDGALLALIAHRHGRANDAGRHYRLRADALERDGRVRLARDNLIDAHGAEAITSPPDIDALLAAREQAAMVAMDNAFRSICFAVALGVAGGPSFSDAYTALQAAFEVPPPLGNSTHSSTWQLEVPAAFEAAINGDHAALQRHRARIDTNLPWFAATGFWLPLTDPNAGLPDDVIEWIEPRDDVVARWQRLVTDRRLYTRRDATTGCLVEPT